MVKIIINYEKCDCANCGECADVCPMEVLVMEDEKIEIKCPQECSLCETCIDVCPNNALTIEDSL